MPADVYVMRQFDRILEEVFEGRLKIEKHLSRAELLAYDRVLARYLKKDIVMQKLRREVYLDYNALGQANQMMDHDNDAIFILFQTRFLLFEFILFDYFLLLKSKIKIGHNHVTHFVGDPLFQGDVLTCLWVETGTNFILYKFINFTNNERHGLLYTLGDFEIDVVINILKVFLHRDISVMLLNEAQVLSDINCIS